MATIGTIAKTDISNAFAGLGSDFLSSADLAKLQESTLKDLSRFMDTKPVVSQKPAETTPNPFMRSNSALNPAYANLKRAADQRAEKREADAKTSAKKSFDGEKSGILGAVTSLFGRKEKSSDSWDNGPLTA